MKATVTQDGNGLRFEIEDDGSDEYRKAVELTCMKPISVEIKPAFVAWHDRTVGELLDTIQAFIDQTDPWISQFTNIGHKIHTPEQKNARLALKELKKRRRA